MNYKKILAGAALFVAAFVGISTPAQAQEKTIVYSAFTGTQDYMGYGTQKAEVYDVAIRLADPDAIGKKIVAIRVPLHGNGSVYSNVKMWISKKLEKKLSPVLSLDATVSQGVASVTLPEAYVIQDPELYIGYSFKVAKADNDSSKYPVLLVPEASEAGFYLHTNRTYLSWVDKSDGVVSSALEVVLSGAKDDAASIAPLGEIYGETGKATETTFTLLNQGCNGVKSVDYSYTVGEQQGSGHVELETPILGYYNASASIRFTLPAMAERGRYPLTLRVDKVNGVANESAPSTDNTLVIYNQLPKRNPVMEEYTGTWCGWCPRGFVAMEVMKRLHPDFIALSYHYGDIMQVMNTDGSVNEFPSNVDGYPSAIMDRDGKIVDPYYGTGSSDLGIEKLWVAHGRSLAPASLKAEAAFAQQGTTIQAKAKLTFPESHADADRYKVEFVLVADDLYGTDKNWLQSNYYASENPNSLPYEEAAPFFKGASKVSGLHYNDVVVASTRLTTGLAALPAQVEVDVEVDIEGEFVLADVKNVNGDPIIQDTKNLRVVALLLDEKGEIANGASAQVTGAETTAIRDICGEATEDASVAIYNFQGHRLQSLQKGVNLVTGKSGKTRKVFVK